MEEGQHGRHHAYAFDEAEGTPGHGPGCVLSTVYVAARGRHTNGPGRVAGSLGAAARQTALRARRGQERRVRGLQEEILAKVREENQVDWDLGQVTNDYIVSITAGTPRAPRKRPRW